MCMCVCMWELRNRSVLSCMLLDGHKQVVAGVFICSMVSTCHRLDISE